MTDETEGRRDVWKVLMSWGVLGLIAADVLLVMLAIIALIGEGGHLNALLVFVGLYVSAALVRAWADVRRLPGTQKEEKDKGDAPATGGQ